MLKGSRKRANVLNTLRQSRIQGDVDWPLEKKLSLTDQNVDLFERIMMLWGGVQGGNDQGGRENGVAAQRAKRP
jgi:hypothetical protein